MAVVLVAGPLADRVFGPLMAEDGSTLSTATRWPASITWLPSASTKVDLPTPGTPEIPSRIELPAWGGKMILAMLVMGFFVALFVAWVYELTPEGIKRESEVDPMRMRPHPYEFTLYYDI